jgi:hypothetical protein
VNQDLTISEGINMQESILQEINRTRRLVLDLTEMAVADQSKWQALRARLLRAFGNLERTIIGEESPQGGCTGGGIYDGNRRR